MAGGRQALAALQERTWTQRSVILVSPHSTIAYLDRPGGGGTTDADQRRAWFNRPRAWRVCGRKRGRKRVGRGNGLASGLVVERRPRRGAAGEERRPHRGMHGASVDNAGCSVIYASSSERTAKNRTRGSADAGPRTWCRTGRTSTARRLQLSSMQPAAHSPAPRQWFGAPERCAARHL